MANSWFQFKQFRIEQDRCAMKVSTDAVLLGSRAGRNEPSSILDVGTGTGVLALMLAQRFPLANVTGVELDEEAAAQAFENFKKSPFSDRMNGFQGRFQDFSSPTHYDLIVSNPPFFQDHLKSIDPKRKQALHTDALSFEDLVLHVSRLLSKTGEFWVILPPHETQVLEKIALNLNLSPFSQLSVKDRETKPFYRQITGFSFSPGDLHSEQLVLKSSDGSYTEGYRQVATGFLLDF